MYQQKLMFHCLSVPPGSRTCWRQRWNKPGWNNPATLKNQPSQAPKSENQHFCLEFTAYPSRTDHVNRPCNPQRDLCLEQQCLTGAYSWVIPFSSSEHLYSLERCWAESALLCNSAEQCHSQNHLGTLALCLSGPCCTFFSKKHGKQCKPSLKTWQVRCLKTCLKYQWLQTDSEVPERGYPKLCCLGREPSRNHPVIVMLMAKSEFMELR